MKKTRCREDERGDQRNVDVEEYLLRTNWEKKIHWRNINWVIVVVVDIDLRRMRNECHWERWIQIENEIVTEEIDDRWELSECDGWRDNNN